MNRRRDFSLRTKLPAMVGAVLLLALATMAALAYLELRRAIITAASVRLESATAQLAQLVGASVLGRVQAINALAQEPAVREFLRSPDEGSRKGAEAILAEHPSVTSVAGGTFEVWNAAFRPVLREGIPLPALDRARAHFLTDGIADDGAVVSAYYTRADTLRYSILARVRDRGNTIGYVVERRRLSTSAAGARQITALIGIDANILLGNARDGAWTDLSGKTIAPPPALARDSSGVVRYARDAGQWVLSRAAPISHTDWMVIVQFPEAQVLAAAGRFLSRSAVLSMLLALACAGGGWFVVRRIVAPIRQITDAAEALAAGRDGRVPDLGRTDEIGRLGVSFNTMASEVQAGRKGLLALADRYRLLFEENPLPAWLCEEGSLAFIEVNDAAVAHYGYSRAEFLGRALGDIEVHQQRSNRRCRASARRAARGLVWHRCADGRVIAVEPSSRVIEIDGRAVVLLVCRDVTESLAVERKLHRSRTALRKLNEELEQRVAGRTAELEVANRELEAFSYSVSHDLRAPLRTVDGFAAMLVEDHGPDLSPEAQRCIDVIRSGAQQMGQLVDDLLAFSRIGRQPISTSRVDMEDLAREVVEEARRRHGDRVVDIVVHPIPPAHGGRTLLKQVFTNFVDNALKFTSKREAARIEIGHRAEAGEIVYYIRDNGAGFDMRYVDKLFGVFQRLHTPDDFEGTGVGLAIVQRILHRHGGRVWAEGARDAGACFHFTLPVGAEP